MPRRELDFYETPPHYIAALLGEVNIFGRVYEPCSGEGAIADALKPMPSVRSVVTNDIDKRRKADHHYDARTAWPTFGASGKKFDWAITNPPFSHELEILETTLGIAENIAFLARLSFLGPTEERAYFLESNPPQQIIVLPRYSFRLNDDGKKQTDNVTCCWMVWFADKTPRRVSVWGRGRSQAEAVIRELVA